MLIPKGMLEVAVLRNYFVGKKIDTQTIATAYKPAFDGSKLTEYEEFRRPVRLGLRPGAGP